MLGVACICMKISMQGSAGCGIAGGWRQPGYCLQGALALTYGTRQLLSGCGVTGSVGEDAINEQRSMMEMLTGEVRTMV